MTFSEAAMIMMSGSDSSIKDPRIAALENATLLGQYDFSNGWSIKVKLCDELNGHHIQYYPDEEGVGDTRVYYHYREIVLWSCYYKNDEFMFAYFCNSYYTDIPGEYYKTNEGIIYNYFERVTDFSEVINFEIKQYYSNYHPFGVYFYVTLKGNQIETYYNSDGSVSNQREEAVEYKWTTAALASYDYQRWSSQAVFRKDYQTYINDILDFSYN